MSETYPYGTAPQPSFVDRIVNFLRTPVDLTPQHLPGTQPKDYLKELSNPDIMNANINQASNFLMGGVMKPVGGVPGSARMGIPEAADMRPAANAVPFTPGNPAQKSIDTYFNALAFNKITSEEFEGFMEALGVDKSLIPDMASSAQRHGTELRRTVREELMGMREEGILRGPEERAQEARSKFRMMGAPESLPQAANLNVSRESMQGNLDRLYELLSNHIKTRKNAGIDIGKSDPIERKISEQINQLTKLLGR